jgi:Arc-like DNA binding domain
MARRLEVDLKLRLSEKLRRKIERAAARNNHSMNTEILERLEESFAADAAERAGAAQAYRDYEVVRGMHEMTGKLLEMMGNWEVKDDGEKK